MRTEDVIEEEAGEEGETSLSTETRVGQDQIKFKKLEMPVFNGKSERLVLQGGTLFSVAPSKRTRGIEGCRSQSGGKRPKLVPLARKSKTILIMERTEGEDVLSILL